MRYTEQALWIALLLALSSCSKAGSTSLELPESPVASASPAAPLHAPDLIIVPEATRSSWFVTQADFSQGDCALEEQCVRAPGRRTLLRFDAESMNVGDQDLVLGDPTANPAFVWSPCHQHYHYGKYMLYELLDPVSHKPVVVQGSSVVGRKQGFCLEDDLDPSGASAGKFDCSYQGLTVGFADVYDSSLDCQWLDVTGVPPGNYLLRLTVNPDHTLTEKDTANNSAEIPVAIPTE